MPRDRSASPVPRPPKADSPRQYPRGVSRQAWTDDEEAIWREHVASVLRAHLLASIRADGRLAHRSGSLGAHLKAYIKKL